VPVADQNNGAFLAGEFQGFEMNFGDQRTSGVNHFEFARFRFVTDGRRHTVGAENQDCAVRDFFDGFDKDGAASAQLLNHVSVVDDFVVHIDGGAVSFQG